MKELDKHVYYSVFTLIQFTDVNLADNFIQAFLQ